MARQTVFEDVVVRGVKVLDIAYSTAAYFIMALVSIIAINRIWKSKGEQETKKSEARLIFEIIFRAFLIGTLAYVARNIFPLIPWPLEGVYGYKHLKTGEVTGSALFAAFAVTFDTQLQAKVSTLKDKLNL
jgi:hypothetical protein